MKMEAQIRMVPVDDIIPNRFQPRLEFDPEAIQELASSIKIHGIVQPLVVRRVQNKFEIIAGERRYKAAQMVGLDSVPVIVVDMDDNESAEVAVIENIHRKDLSPIEEAKSFRKILDKGYLTQDQLATRMGMAQSTLANKLRLLSLDEAVQHALQKNEISERHARSLLKLSDKMKQVDLLNDIIRDRLTVKQVDEEIDRILNGYKRDDAVTGSINVDSKTDIDLSKQLNNSDDLGDAVTPKEYQYRSKISEDANKSLFFNNLENAPATMEDPTLSFGFNTFKNQEKIDDNSMVDLEEELDDEVVSPSGVSEAFQEEIKNRFNFNVSSPRDLTKAINKLLQQSIDTGVEIRSEEFDFTDIYQIVIKITKEKANEVIDDLNVTEEPEIGEVKPEDGTTSTSVIQ